MSSASVQDAVPQEVLDGGVTLAGPSHDEAMRIAPGFGRLGS